MAHVLFIKFSYKYFPSYPRMKFLTQEGIFSWVAKQRFGRKKKKRWMEYRRVLESPFDTELLSEA